jgi:hypothetical protein
MTLFFSLLSFPSLSMKDVATLLLTQETIAHVSNLLHKIYELCHMCFQIIVNFVQTRPSVLLCDFRGVGGGEGLCMWVYVILIPPYKVSFVVEDVKYHYKTLQVSGRGVLHGCTIH